MQASADGTSRITRLQRSDRLSFRDKSASFHGGEYRLIGGAQAAVHHGDNAPSGEARRVGHPARFGRDDGLANAAGQVDPPVTGGIGVSRWREGAGDADGTQWTRPRLRRRSRSDGTRQQEAGRRQEHDRSFQVDSERRHAHSTPESGLACPQLKAAVDEAVPSTGFR
jgi:hypothetical protein